MMKHRDRAEVTAETRSCPLGQASPRSIPPTAAMACIALSASSGRGRFEAQLRGRWLRLRQRPFVSAWATRLRHIATAAGPVSSAS